MSSKNRNARRRQTLPGRCKSKRKVKVVHESAKTRRLWRILRKGGLGFV